MGTGGKRGTFLKRRTGMGAGAGFDRCTFAAGDDVPKKDQQETVYPGKSN